jgi:hypothetical protein
MTTNPTPSSPSSERRWLWLAAVVLLMLSVAALLVPLMILRPFSPQTPQSVAMAFSLRRIAPLGCTMVALAILLLETRLWRGARWSRVGLVLLGVFAIAVAGLARVNVFEKMFAPIAEPTFASAKEASWVAPRDLVLSLSEPAGPGSGHAFPVRQIAYHHIVNLEVAGRPLVVTY